MNAESKVYVVVTAYNEAKYLGRFLGKLQQKTKNFIVVDDGSSDETAAIATKYTPHVLIHPINLGKGAAMKTGADYAFEHLAASEIIFMDGDDQHDVDDLAHFYKTLRQLTKPKLILGIRSLQHKMPISRVFGNKLASLLVQILFGQYVPDIPSGFKAMDQATYQQLRWRSTDYSVEMEIACKIAKKHLSFITLPIKTIYHDLDRGMNLTDSLKMVYKILMWRIDL